MLDRFSIFVFGIALFLRISMKLLSIKKEGLEYI